MSEIATEAVQTEATPTPEGGASADVQGGQGTSGLYNLDAIPEAIRSQVEPVFKEWEGNVTKEFQKRAEALDAWKPYEEMGLRNWNPEDVQRLVAFGELASDDTKFKDWIAEAYKQLHGDQPEGEAKAAEAAAPEGAPTDQPLTPDRVQEMIAEAREAERAAAAEEQQQQAAIEEVATQIRSTLDELKGKHGDFDEDEVLFQAQRFTDVPAVEAIEKGFAHLQKLLGQAEAGVLREKLDAPPSPEKGGRADATATPPRTFAEAQARTAEHLRQTRNL